MNSEFELIRYSENLPARIELKQGKIITPYHWHKEIELVYVLDGDVKIKVNTLDRDLHADEFLLLNSGENHSISAENAKCLILDISYEFAEQFDSSFYNSTFMIVGGSGAEEEIHNGGEIVYQHQTIEYDNILPAKIKLNERNVNRCRGEPHWHEEMQLIYVDEGSLTLTV